MKIIERNLQEIGQSLLITLPKEWTRLFKLKKGSKVKIAITEKNSLLISPEFVTKPEEKEVVITFDERFPRRFFHEYFLGNEKITIKFNEKIKELERKEMYSFLEKFINVQIIEDTPIKVIVKCFKINELSIEECLRRMYFITANMIEKVLSNNEIDKKMGVTLLRFYYMLVMQIRRFLAEGKFADENQISLVRAMDLRMVAEKIERIKDILIGLGKINDKDFLVFLKLIKEFYSKSFNVFISGNYEKALELWLPKGEFEKYKNKIESKANASKTYLIYEQAIKLLQLLEYVREISMFVR